MTTEPSDLHVVLVEPEIHWNTGNAGRTCLAVGARLHLVGPLGFFLSERQVRRGGGRDWAGGGGGPRLRAGGRSRGGGPRGRFRAGDPPPGRAVLLQRRGGAGFLGCRVSGADGADLRQGERGAGAGDPRPPSGAAGADPHGRSGDPLAQSLDVGGAGGV